MKVAVVGPNHGEQLETFVRAHIDYLKGNVSYYHGEPYFLDIDSKKTTAPNSRLQRLLYKLYGSFKRLTWYQYALLKSFKESRVSVVLAEYATVAINILPACKAGNIPLVVHLHGYDAYVKKIIDANKASYKEMFDYASCVVVVSEHMRQQVITLGCSEFKIVLNPYGPNENFFDVKNISNGNTFVALGRFVEKKAPYYLVLAFYNLCAEFPDITLVIGGDGPLIDACKNIAKALKIDKRVFFPGKITRQDFAVHLSGALSFIQHSITAANGDSEGTPVAILEAMAAGVPVISTRHAGIPELVIDGETGLLVDEHDVSGMSFQMQRLLKNKALARQLGESGRQRVLAHYTMKKHIDILNEVILKAAV